MIFVSMEPVFQNNNGSDDDEMEVAKCDVLVCLVTETHFIGHMSVLRNTGIMY